MHRIPLLLAIVLGASVADATVYTFTNVVDSTAMAVGPQTPPSINNLGVVAFIAGPGTWGPHSVYKSDGLTWVQVGQSGAYAFAPIGDHLYTPVINDAGQVAFFAQYPYSGGCCYYNGLFVGNGTILTTIADSFGPLGSFHYGYVHEFAIASSGHVAFGTGGDGFGTSDLRVWDGAAMSTVYDGSGGFYPYFGQPVDMNDSGALVFYAYPRSDDPLYGGLYVGSGGSATPVAAFGDEDCWLSSVGSINNAGQVAYFADPSSLFECNSPQILRWTNGVTSTVASADGPLAPFGDPAINDDGAVAFLAFIDSGGGGIFTGNTLDAAVIKTGDTLFGSTVVNLGFSRHGFNNDGDVAFYYKLADNRQGHARANAVPDCSNGLDDDADGLVDSSDPGCSDADDRSERSPSLVCDNGLDDDADTLIDYPADLGCASPTSTRENPQCNDGIDNDGDSFADLLDPHCSGPTDNREASGTSGGGCGIGPELAVLLPGLLLLHRRRGLG